MLKHLYKLIILLGVFVFSLYYFSGYIKVEDRREKLETVKMGEITYPVISIMLEDTEINLLHGYSSNIDSRMSREAMTPLDADQSFKLAIKENNYKIKRVDYELRSIYDDKIIESGNIKVLEEEGDYKVAKLRFKDELSKDKEYYARITLVSDKSKKINYYTRLKRIDESFYNEKIEYVKYFREATFNKDESIAIYLEKVDNSLDDLSRVTVNSHFDLVTWGQLQPKVIGKIVPTIKEISNDFASIELKYMISAETEMGVEDYHVVEFYKIRYSPTRTYLLTYERTMEPVFTNEKLNGKTGELKLGIRGDSEVDLVSTGDSTKIGTVVNRDLWYFDQATQESVRVFSFRQEDGDYIRDVYDEHDIKIINIADNGNIDFMVYGYMNRGAYEGYVGIVLYRFYSMDKRIEELTYIPVNISYQFLKEMVGDFNYINELETFYFHINDTIYAYNLITKGLSEITKGVDEGNFVFSKEEQYIAWEEKDSNDLSKKLIIYDLEKETKKEILAEGETVLKLLGTVGVDIVYGLANISDLVSTIEGKRDIPMYKLIISDSKGKTLKEYQDEVYSILDIEVKGNIITVKRGRIRRENNTPYIVPDKDDNILSNIDIANNNIKTVRKNSEIANKEWYIRVSSLSSNSEKYQYYESRNTVVTKDTTLRIDKDIEYPGKYIVYALGDVMGIYKDAGRAISEANKYVGLAFTSNQDLLWERGKTKSTNQITNLELSEKLATKDSFKASAITLIDHKYNNVTIPNNMNGYELLVEYFGDSYVNLTGAKLEEVLYFVSENRPVIARNGLNNYVVIVGYTNSNLTIFDPIGRRQRTISREEADRGFEELGNIFISYSDQ